MASTKKRSFFFADGRSFGESGARSHPIAVRVAYGALMLMSLGAVSACSGAPEGVNTLPPTTIGSTLMAVPPTTAKPAPTTVATPTTPVPSTTSTPSVPRQPTNDEFIRIIEALNARTFASYGNPATADVASFCVLQSDCDVYKQLAIDNMLRDGQRIVNQPSGEVASIDRVHDLSTDEGSLIEPASMYEVTFTLVDEGDQFGQIVDPNGEVVFNLTPGGDYPVETRILVRITTDDPEGLMWRFDD